MLWQPMALIGMCRFNDVGAVSAPVLSSSWRLLRQACGPPYPPDATMNIQTCGSISTIQWLTPRYRARVSSSHVGLDSAS